MRTTRVPWSCATPVSLTFVMLLGSIFICKNGCFCTWLWLLPSGHVKSFTSHLQKKINTGKILPFSLLTLSPRMRCFVYMVQVGNQPVWRYSLSHFR